MPGADHQPRPPQGPAREPDPPPIDAIWAPWRLEYLKSIDDTAAGDRPAPHDQPESKAHTDTPTTEATPSREGFLAAYWNAPDRDEEHHVVHRDALGMILLNRYPYSNGHLLVALGEPRPALLDYDHRQRAHLWALVDLAARILTDGLEPHGINIGVNQGRAAGAGVPDHLHVHLVPRWNGDINFMTSVGAIRVIPSSLDMMAQRFREAAAGLTPPAPDTGS